MSGNYPAGVTDNHPEFDMPNAEQGRFVLCHFCDGSGVVVVAGVPSRWPDGSENDEERPCPECQGEGVVEIETSPVEMDDGQPTEAQEWADFDKDC